MVPCSFLFKVKLIHIQPSSQGNDNIDPALFSDKGGYYKFPNGLIMQWGIYDPFGDNVSDSYKTLDRVTFPISFPHDVFYVQSIPQLNVDKDTSHPWLVPLNITNSGFSIRKGRSSWIALGY